MSQDKAWAAMCPTDHINRAEEESKAGGNPVLAGLHLQAAQVRASQQLFSLLVDRVQYVDTRGLR